MTFASDMQAVALDLLSDLGQSVTVSRVTEGSYNPVTSDVLSSTTSSYTGYGHPSPYTAQEIDGDLIRNTDIKLLMYSTTTPDIGDVITLDGVAFRVMSVGKLKAEGSNIVYRVQLRL